VLPLIKSGVDCYAGCRQKLVQCETMKRIILRLNAQITASRASTNAACNVSKVISTGSKSLGKIKTRGFLDIIRFPASLKH
jgi:hypothetical protein